MNKAGRKTFVLDTNTLIHDPEALNAFGNNDVVIPIAVLEELAQMKKYRDEPGKNARSVLWCFDNLKQEGEGDLHQGIALENGTRIRIQLEIKNDYSPNFALSLSNTSYRILMAALFLLEKESVWSLFLKILRCV